MSNKIDPVLQSEEHAIIYVQDFAELDMRYEESHIVWWDGYKFSASSQRGLVEQIIAYEEISNGI